MPSYFKCNYEEIRKNSSHSVGKKIFHIPVIKNNERIIQDLSYHSLPRSKINRTDQDLDSLKLSIQPDITRGYKNTLRYKSNHYQSFFEKIESFGFRRLGTEITCIYKMPKITRIDTLQTEKSSKIKISPIRLNKGQFNEECKNNELSYLLELHSCKSKQKTLPKLKKKIKSENEIDVFEKRLKDTYIEKRRNLYDINDTKKKK